MPDAGLPPFKPPPDTWDATSSFLIAEYEQFSADFRANEESGERRVSLLLAIATAAVGAVGIAAEGSGFDAKALRGPAAILLAGMAVIGLATLFRLVKRNVVSDEYKTAMDSIRAIFRYWDGEVLADYNPFVSFRDVQHDRGGGRKIWGIIPSGLVLLVAVINAALATGVVIALADPDFDNVAILSGSAAFFFVFAWLQLFAAEKAEEDLKAGRSGLGKLSLGAPELGERYKNGGLR
jgi:hypothetical protein